MTPFSLDDYRNEISKIAKTNGSTEIQALYFFITNLNTLSDTYTGADLNFRSLGQEWSRLPSATRLAQQKALEKILSSETISTRSNSSATSTYRNRRED